MPLKHYLKALVLTISTVISAPSWGNDDALDSQIVPGFGLAETRAANDKVEEVIIRAYDRTFQHLKRTRGLAAAIALVNAPISGQTEKRGRHLLSLAAFSGFKELALWGLNHGALINGGDKDNATMLRMAMANRLYYMVEFALENGANPNLKSGSGNRNLLGDMLVFSWPLRGFELAWKHGARFKNEEQKTLLIQYLAEKEKNPDNYLRVQTLINRFDRPDAVSKTAQPVSRVTLQVKTEMIEMIDRELLAAIKGGEIPPAFVTAYSSHGTPLPHYLTFNGFTNSLQEVLKGPRGPILVKRRDRTCNDLLTSAIKSLNVEAVDIVLATTASEINRVTPNLPDCYSGGDYPLHIAVKWKVPDEVFASLLRHGARESLNLRNSSGFTPAELVESWFTKGYLEDQSYQRLIRALQL